MQFSDQIPKYPPENESSQTFNRLNNGEVMSFSPFRNRKVTLKVTRLTGNSLPSSSPSSSPTKNKNKTQNQPKSNEENSEEKEQIKNVTYERRKNILEFVEGIFSLDPDALNGLSLEKVYQDVMVICRLGSIYAKELWTEIQIIIKEKIKNFGTELIDKSKKIETSHPPLSTRPGIELGETFLIQIENLFKVSKSISMGLSYLDLSYLRKPPRVCDLSIVINTEYSRYLENEHVINGFVEAFREYQFFALTNPHDHKMKEVEKENEPIDEENTDNWWLEFDKLFSKLQVASALSREKVAKKLLKTEYPLLEWIIKSSNSTSSFDLSKIISSLSSELNSHRESYMTNKELIKKRNLALLEEILSNWKDKLWHNLGEYFSENGISSLGYITTTIIPSSCFADYITQLTEAIVMKLTHIVDDASNNRETLIKNLIGFQILMKSFTQCAEKDNETLYSDKLKQLRQGIFYSWKRIKYFKEHDDQMAEDLALFVEKQLRDKSIEPKELTKQLEGSRLVFQHLDARDVFEKHYRVGLSRRLLQNRFIHKDDEIAFVSMLRDECGANYTESIQTMINDYETSKLSSLNFVKSKDYKSLNGSDKIDFSVTVLTDRRWPNIKETPINLPTEMRNIQQKYENFYRKGYDGYDKKILTWVPNRDSIIIRSRFKSGRKEFVVDSFQTVILMLFNSVKDTESIPYSRIENKTGVPAKDLNAALFSLVYGKYPILLRHRNQRKNDKGEEIQETPLTSKDKIIPSDLFSVNVEFKEKAYRLVLYPYFKPKISLSSLDETTDPDSLMSSKENLETSSSSSTTSASILDEARNDRTLEVEAAIIRILKKTRQLGHQELFEKVVRVTTTRSTRGNVNNGSSSSNTSDNHFINSHYRGPIEISIFKKALDILLRNNFIERDPNNQNTYNYVV